MHSMQDKEPKYCTCFGARPLLCRQLSAQLLDVRLQARHVIHVAQVHIMPMRAGAHSRCQIRRRAQLQPQRLQLARLLGGRADTGGCSQAYFLQLRARLVRCARVQRRRLLRLIR